MDKLKMQTTNHTDENFTALAAMFPNAVTESVDENGVIDADVLRREINMHAINSDRIFRDSSFASDSTLVNYDQIFRTYIPTTQWRVL